MSDSSEPLVKARFCQDWLALVAQEQEPYRTRFFARVTPEMRAQIDGAARVAWLPIALHVGLADIQLASFGPARAHDYYRRAFVSAIKGPIFAPVLMTAVRLLGLSPGTFARWASRGHDTAYKNVGTMQGEVLGTHRAQITFSGLPEICARSDGWVMSTQGSAYGVYDLLEMRGVVRIDTSERAQGKIVLELEWGDRNKPA